MIPVIDLAKIALGLLIASAPCAAGTLIIGWGTDRRGNFAIRLIPAAMGTFFFAYLAVQAIFCGLGW